MQKLLLRVFALAAISGSALLAQSLTGAWQGTLQPPGGKELRVVIKISTTDADGFKAALYSLDQVGQPMNATSVALQGSTVKISIVGVGGTYEGKLSADGNSITGIWNQGPVPLPLNLKRATNETAWTIPEPPPPTKAMPVGANPVFEVATIKRSSPNSPPGKRFMVAPGGRQISTNNTSLNDLITFAWGIHTQQIIGAPGWLETDKFDIQAKPDLDGQPSDKQLRAMMQKVLVDRFKLRSHRERRELTVYTLTVVRTGPKLIKSDGDPNGLPGLGFRGLGNLVARNANMTDFANVMQTTALDRPVVDQTGISGRYDFMLKWTPDESQFGGRGGQGVPPVGNGDVPPDLYTAIQQQLGLRLDSTKEPVEVLVIDRVERPSEN